MKWSTCQVTYILLLILKINYLLIQLLKSIGQIYFVTDNRLFVLLLYSQFHFLDLHWLWKFIKLTLQILLLFHLLPSLILNLWEISLEVFYLLFLLPVELSHLLCCVLKILQHVAKFCKWILCLIQNISSRFVIHAQLDDSLPMVVHVSFTLICLACNLLSFQFNSPSFLLHEFELLVFKPQLPIYIL